MKDFSNYYPPIEEEILNDAMWLFEQQLNTIEGEDVTIDDIQERVVIRNHSNEMNEFKEERIMLTRMSSNVHRGAVVHIDGQNHWIVTTDIDEHHAYKKCKIQKTNRILRWVNKHGILIEQHCISKNETLYTLGTKEDEQQVIGNSKQSVQLPTNNETLEIDYDDRFYIDRRYWKVANISEDNKGIIKLLCGQDKYNPSTDNKELGVADYYNKINSCKMEVNTENLIITKNEQFNLDVRVYQNDKQIENPQIEYIISNTNLISIENNIVTALDDGNCELKMEWNGIEKVIPIIISKTNVNNYSITYESSNSRDFIKFNKESTYSFKTFVDGIQKSDTYVFTLGETDLAEIISTTENSCTIKTKDINVGEIILVAHSNKVGLDKEVKIKIKSYWE